MPGRRTWIAGLLALAIVATVVVVGLAASNSRTIPDSVICPPARPITISSKHVPAGPVAGFCQDRLVNAAHIMKAGRDMKAPGRAQTIAVMTALGESGLRVLNRGDTAGPDSRGLFQQRANGIWGTTADRMNPEVSATNFYTQLLAVPQWSTIPPSRAAHLVQFNSDENYYAKYWAQAVLIVEALDR